MNVEDYEDKAIQKSNAAKRIAVGGAAFLGGAAVPAEQPMRQDSLKDRRQTRRLQLKT